MSLASAGFWGDGWGFLITGNVVAEENAGILEGEESSGGGESAPAPSDSGSSGGGESSSGDSGSSSDGGSSGGDSGSSSDGGSSGGDSEQQIQDDQYHGDQGSPGDYQQDFSQGAPNQEQMDQYKQQYGKEGESYPGQFGDQQYQGDQRPPGDQNYQQGGDYNDQGQFRGAPQGQGQYGQYQQPSCPDENSLAEMSQKCEEHGGSATERQDPYRGCTISECFFNGGGQGQGGPQGQGQFGQGGPGSNAQGGQGLFGEGACQSEEEAEEQSSLCADFSSEAIAVPSPPGCAPRIVCAQQGQGYGSGHLSYGEYKQGQERFDSGELGSAQVLEVILKMDSIKIQLSGVQQKMEDIAGYYESQGDTESAENYRDGAAILDQVGTKIDEQKVALKDAVSAGTLDYSSIYEIRSDLKYSVDELLNQVISALLGVEYTGIAQEAGEGSDCGSNPLCFEEYFRTCASGASFDPESGVSVSISGVTEEDECQLSVSSPMGAAECMVPNYRYARLSKESIMPYCEGSLQERFSQYDGYQPTEEFSQESFEGDIPSSEPTPTETSLEAVVPEEPLAEEEVVVEEPVVEETPSEEQTEEVIV